MQQSIFDANMNDVIEGGNKNEGGGFSFEHAALNTVAVAKNY